ncbi:MAG: hypothetical protein JW963_18360 [Anaerolineales bacterium]|nr:hypothetical protein [Anaerolineales bacterium]
MKKTRGRNALILATLVAGIFSAGVCVNDNRALSLAQSGGVSLKKEGKPDTFTQAGEQIEYTYTITNNAYSSDGLLHNVSVSDDRTAVNCPASELGYGETMTCTATYTVTEEDVSAGEVKNTASLSGYYLTLDTGCCSCNDYVSHNVSIQTSFTAKLVLTAPAYLAMDLEKRGSPSTFTGADEVINYSYEVTNTGTETIPGPINVSDDLVDVTCPGGSLAPSQSLTCTASYTTTLQDVAAGSITNNAVARAGDVEASDSFTVTLNVNPALQLDKSADPVVFSREVELVKFIFKVTNSGDVPIGQPFTINDSMPLSDINCPFETLSPGASLTCTGWYVTTALDVNQTVNNCATASGFFNTLEVTSNEACVSVYYQAPVDNKGKEPEEPETEEPPYCELYPDDPICYEYP